MSFLNQLYVAALVAAHPDQKIIGRTRLQKEVKLLQRLGFPTDYSYSIHFYGPYSESLQCDIGLMEAANLLEETRQENHEGNEYFILHATTQDRLPEISSFQRFIDKLIAASSVVLELAATYDAFRESGDDHPVALERLRRKKGGEM